MPSADATRHSQHSRQRLRSGLWVAGTCLALVCAEFGYWWVGEPVPSLAPETVLASDASAKQKVLALHIALSRGEYPVDAKLRQRLLSSPEPLVREFAASPTVSKFGHLEAVTAAVRAESDVRQAFRLRFWRNYQLDVWQPPMFLTPRGIERYFASLAAEPNDFESLAPVFRPHRSMPR